jgi:sugar phosphate isomerase/epimerase
VAQTRRTFITSLAAAYGSHAFGASGADAASVPAPGAAGVQPAATAPAGRGIRLGFDHFALRSLGWTAAQFIDHAASLRLDAVFLSELRAFERRDDAYLKDLRARADKAGVAIFVGSGSICPTSGTFDAKAGSAVEQTRDAIRIAKTLGSPVLRCFLGRFDDRLTHGGIETHIRNTIEVCRAVRDDLRAAGIKLAVENHAGDMQAWELAGLVEAAGPEHVGVNLDPGNATWTLEDPVASLEILAPYVVCTSIRDSAVWESPEGAVVEWTAVGDGTVDFRRWTTLFAERCRQVPIFVETISGLRRPFAYNTPDFWTPWPRARAKDFARFVQLARRGQPRPAPPAPLPPGPARQEADRAQQTSELERSLAYCRQTLGLGVRV